MFIHKNNYGELRQKLRKAIMQIFMLINLGMRGATSRRKSQIPEGPTPEEKSKKLIEGYRESCEQVHRKLSETARKFARTALVASCNKPCQKNQG